MNLWGYTIYAVGFLSYFVIIGLWWFDYLEQATSIVLIDGLAILILSTITITLIFSL